MAGYYGIRKFLTTPVPFPLIQMARTFLFLYGTYVIYKLRRTVTERVTKEVTTFSLSVSNHARC